MTESTSKKFDCVQETRRIRDQISAEIAELSFEELVRWLKSCDYSDPVLKRIAKKVGQGATNDPSRRN